MSSNTWDFQGSCTVNQSFNDNKELTSRSNRQDITELSRNYQSKVIAETADAHQKNRSGKNQNNSSTISSGSSCNRSAGQFYDNNSDEIPTLSHNESKIDESAKPQVDVN